MGVEVNGLSIHSAAGNWRAKMEASMGRPTKEYQAFARLTDRLLAVPRDVVEQRITRHREQADQNPRKRGPKRKATALSASDHEPS